MKVIASSVLVLLSACTAAVYYFSGPQRTMAQEAGAVIVLYSETGFRGRQLVVERSLPDLPVLTGADGGEEFDWNDNVRSVRVLSGTWRVFQHGRFNTALDETPIASFDASAKPLAGGWSTLLSPDGSGPLEIPDLLSCGVVTPEISSLRLVSERPMPPWLLTSR